ncbi:MAG: tRNA (5-methylaminomethyl-2-thiouridylate)-methyltransferase [Candidatus Latescibacterota bacterium]
MRKAKGIGLISGGLDSALACKVLKEAGADISCLHFFTGFCVTGHHSRVGRKDKPVANDALQVAAEIDVPLDMIDISQDYLNIVLHPKHGYGANMNPCIDCREFMLRKAKAHMENLGADFVFTGEVIGQRPMSQTRRTLDDIEMRVGLQERLLRPLSAKLLPPTQAEKDGLIDREKLYGFHGRSRKPQLALAEKYGITRFAQPAGGCCFLTDEPYSRKFRDMIRHGGEDSLSMDDIYLLGVGRHLRLSPTLKIIIGRDEVENNFLARYGDRHWLATATQHPGATALIVGDMDDEAWRRIAAIAARYSDGRQESTVEVRFTFDDQQRTMTISPASNDLIDPMRI